MSVVMKRYDVYAALRLSLQLGYSGGSRHLGRCFSLSLSLIQLLPHDLEQPQTTFYPHM